MAIQACRKQGKYVGICGQGPSDHPDFADWLAAEGIVSISLNPDSVIATWKHPFSKWNPADEQTHEAFRREQVVMGMVQDGHVVFGNDSDRQRLIKNASK